jgi:hypothetical protein
MKKKSQYYIVTVFIICLAVFGFLSITQGQRAKTDSFTALYENCYKESVFAMNQAVRNSGNIFTEMKNFADDFTQYSKAIDSSFGFVYLATDAAGSTRIVNLLEPDTLVYVDTDTLSENITQNNYVTDSTDYVNLTIHGNTYMFNSTQKPNMQFLFWMQKQGMLRVKQK